MRFTPVDELPPKGHAGGATTSPETRELAQYLNDHIGQWLKYDEATTSSYGISLKSRLNKVAPAEYEVRYRQAEAGAKKYWIFVRRVS